VQGLRAYRAIGDVSETVDVAMIAVAADRVLALLEECAAAGVHFSLVFASGFAETGQAAAIGLQNRMRDLAQATGMRIVGPNCIGSLNVWDRIPLGFAAPFSQAGYLSGPVSFVSQSGAFGYGFMTLAEEEHVGFRYVANTGNQSDLSAVDFLEFFAADPDTRIIAAYIEGVGDGPRFTLIAEECARQRKPLVVYKVGHSPVARRAVASHTATLAGSGTAFEAVASRAGVLSVHDVDEMLDVIKVLIQEKVPQRHAGVAIVTTTGASGVMAADACAVEDVPVADLSDATRRQLAAFIPVYGSVANPVDLTAMVIHEPGTYAKAYQTVREAPEVGALALLHSTPTGVLVDALVTGIMATVAECDKPVVNVITSGGSITAAFRQKLRERGVAVYTCPRRAIRALRHLYRYAGSLERIAASREALPPIALDGRASTRRAHDAWTEVTVKALLHEHGIAVPAGGVAHVEHEALAIAANVGYPIAAKAVAHSMLHKSEAGAVQVGIADPEALRRAYAQVVARARKALGDQDPDGVLVEQMVPDGVEAFVAVVVDPIHGPIVGFGLGGVLVELYQDVAWWPAPLTTEEAEMLVRRVRGFPLLTGYRGRPPADVPALVDALRRVSWIGVEMRGEMAELEINPLAVLPAGKGVVALDAVLMPAVAPDGEDGGTEATRSDHGGVGARP
jgi:acyl-CoA synthetase (NDP forming)